MSVHQAITLLRQMRENNDQSLTGEQVAALDLAITVLSALSSLDRKTVDTLFFNYFD